MRATRLIEMLSRIVVTELVKLRQLHRRLSRRPLRRREVTAPMSNSGLWFIYQVVHRGFGLTPQVLAHQAQLPEHDIPR